MRIATLAGLTLALISLPACSGGGGNNFTVPPQSSLVQAPQATPTPPAVCLTINGPPSLIAPAPGATGVAQNPGPIVVERNTASQLTLASSAGPVAVGPLVSATPPPGYTGSDFFSASVQQLATATTYTVTAIVPDVCDAGARSYAIGSFTTTP